MCTCGYRPRPLVVRAPEPMLALPAPGVGPQIEEIEKMLGASQEGFQDAIMKQMQRLTDQLALVIKSNNRIHLLRWSRGGMQLECGASNVNNHVIRVNTIKIDRIKPTKQLRDTTTKSKAARVESVWTR